MKRREVLNKLASGELTVEKAKALLWPNSRPKDFETLFNKAHEAGMEAGNAVTPRPMLVGSPSTPLGNDIDPNKETWLVSEGVCGFAWIKIGDGRSAFARWLKKTDRAGDAYPRGVSIWVSEFGQSMQRKEAYARAFANVLQEAGIKNVYAQSRMD
jgi:hypothetical protein